MCWIEDETRTSDFGDARLDARMKTILKALSDKPAYSIPQACGGWAETLAAYRFFDNDKVTYEPVLQVHSDATLERIRRQPVVLLPQDTTEMILTRQSSLGIGTLKKTAKKELFVHPVLAITPERIPLGVVSLDLWDRPEQSIRKERFDKPIEEKESFRWIEGYQAACAIQSQALSTLVVMLADREGDIYEMFAEMNEYSPALRAAWIIRSAQDRVLESADPGIRKLRKKLYQSPVLGTLEFVMPASGTRKARKVSQEVRAARVTLKPPARWIKEDTLPSVTIHAVYAKETNPPPGQKAVEWLLLTCLPIDTFEEVSRILHWYTARWEIEIYFRVLKQGCEVEKLQFADKKRFAVCLAFYMIVAWRVLYVTMLGREYPNIDCEAIFDKEEWKTLFIVVKQQAPPEKPPGLFEMILLVAGLGGFLARKVDAYPGPKSIWIGLQRLRDLVWAIQRYQSFTTTHAR